MSLSATYDKEKAFTKLYYASRDRLFHYLRNYSEDEHLLEDLMQQCYMKVWEGMEDVWEPEQAFPLLKTIGRNLLIDLIRSRMKNSIWLETMKGEVERLISLPDENPRKPLQALDTAINQLPDNCRQVYIMHREEGLSYREISIRMSVSVSMVEKHMSKAIRLLKKDLITNCEILLLLVAVNKLL